MNAISRPIAITAGEPAGIGPELIVRLAAAGQLADAVIIADPGLLASTANRLGLVLSVDTVSEPLPAHLNAGPEEARKQPAVLHCLPVHCTAPVVPGSLDARNARYVLETLQRAAQGCLAGEFSAMVTAPLHKGIINQAGVPFTGHTEYLAELSKTPKVVMMLLNRHMRVALATTHLPLREVAAAISPPELREVLRILLADLRGKFGLSQPRVAVCGLNPHAGEGGVLGHEEDEIIEPVIAEFQAAGEAVSGPVPADTLFTPPRLAQVDAVLAMYHDQGLAPLKYAGFGDSVNLTLGLPFIRTSVDHGTALDIAGQGRAATGSLQAALALARQLAANAHSETQPATPL